MALTACSLHTMDNNVGGAEVPVYQSEKRLIQMEKNLRERIDAAGNRLIAKLDDLMLWVLGFYVAQTVGVLLVLAKAFKWI